MFNDCKTINNNHLERFQGSLLGYYFTDPYLQDFSMLAVTPNISNFTLKASDLDGFLSKEKQKIQSARWIGSIQPVEDGEYIFSTSANHHVIMTINGNIILNQKPMKESIYLKKENVYELCIEYQQQHNSFSNNLLEFQLHWGINSKKSTFIPKGCLFFPDISINRTRKSPLIPEFSLFEMVKQKENNSVFYTSKISRDSDGDGIYDDLEKNGYVADESGLKVVAWDEEIHGNNPNYTKYISHPGRANTVKDPYSDLEKAIGYMPASVNTAAQNPLVAAIPEISVDMESFDIIRLSSSGTDTSNSISQNTSTSDTESFSWGLSESLDVGFAGGFIPSVSVNVSSHQDWSNSTTSTFDNGTSESWSSSLHWETGSAARLVARLRFKNRGTAPVYDLAPKFNIVMADGKKSIRTIKAGEDLIANDLTPGSEYPKKGNAPIVLDRQGDFESDDLKIDIQTLNQIESDGALLLQTPEFSGSYNVINAVGQPIYGGEYGRLLEDLKQTTAHIVLDSVKGGLLDRRVATRNENDPKDATPILTLGEAIKIAFRGRTDKDGNIQISDLSIDKYNVDIYVDGPTAAHFEQQLTEMPNPNIFQVKLFTLEDDHLIGGNKVPMTIIIKERRPADGLQDGVYSILTKMNQDFSMKNDNELIKMDFAYDYPDRTFNVTWDTSMKSYTCKQSGTNLALGIENGRIVAKPFDKTNLSQYWSIQKTRENTYAIESFSQPLQ
ncbi:TPA: binary toxin-like calcium binding domain-containing protein, partial [Bacillus cereus]